jgi:hypothetical protein
MGLRDWFKGRNPSKTPDVPASQPVQAFSDAYQDFMQSTKIGYAEWHDGIPYNMDIFRALSASERDMIVRHLATQHGPAFDWRDIEVFQAAATPEALAALHAALQSSRADSRLYAASALHALGQLPDLNGVVACELDHVTIVDGMAYALRLVGKNPPPEIRAALLRGAREHPEVGPHYAAMLCYCAGKAATEFDWNMRPFFLRFGEHASPDDHAKAYRELCQLVGVSPPQD